VKQAKQKQVPRFARNGRKKGRCKGERRADAKGSAAAEAKAIQQQRRKAKIREFFAALE